MFANKPPPELTKSAIFSAFVVNVASITEERDQLSGIQINAGCAEVIVEAKNVSI
jgi:hypothetical protein